MADLPSRDWLVPADNDVKLMWHDKAMQEKRSAIAAGKRTLDEFKQKIEDIEKGMILDVQARIIMLERELVELEKQRTALEAGQIIDVEANNDE